jgi:hypothetical protein
MDYDTTNSIRLLFLFLEGLNPVVAILGIRRTMRDILRFGMII